MSQDDELDWFDQDEDDLVNNLKKNLNAEPSDSNIVEFITIPGPVSNAHLICNLNASSQKSIGTPKLREVSKMKALEAFLIASTAEFDFFNGQIAQNDSMERVLLYVQVLLLIISLELPGFHTLILKSIARNEPLLEHFSNISKKLFSAKYKSMWSDTSKVDEIVLNIEALLRTLQATTVTEQYLKVVGEINMLMKSSDAPLITKRSTCINLGKTIDSILSERRAVEDSKTLEDTFPSLEELISTNKQQLQDIAEISKSALINKRYKNDSEYINVQKYLLREDFMISLRDCVKSLITNHQPCSRDTIYLEDVQIIHTHQFLEAYATQMVYADVLGSSRSLINNTQKKSRIARLRNLKSGALLCFTTSFDFENLVLAVVTVSNKSEIEEGFIAIDVVKQYNIGSIYNTKFLMFESPEFFEPYHNVFKVMKTYAGSGAENIPMRKYIVDGETISAAPAYLKKNFSHADNETDKHGHLNQLTENLNLNESQTQAFKRALCEEFCLIQGPPGTGKTYLSVKIVKTLIDKANGPIVLITYTNESLDKFLSKISKYTDSIVRFGIGSKNRDLDKFNLKNYEEEEHQVNPLTKRLNYTTKILYKEEYEALQKLYKDFDGTDDNYKTIVNAQKKLQDTKVRLKTIKTLFKYEMVKSKQVIAMTTTCAAKTNFLFKLLESPIVVFEEAAEILESHVIACLTGFTQHVIMIGDHMQLQPYTSNSQHSRVHEMNVSLFERLIQRGMANIMLRIQYRMRPEFVKLICPMIYNELQNGLVVDSYPQVKGMQKNLFFLSYNKSKECSDEQSSSKYNNYECEELIKLTKHLIKKGKYEADEIVILSPYNGQIRLILKKLRADRDLCKVQATSVDNFQGLEKEIVLLSLVRSNPFERIGFLNEKNRICVSLSRAKLGLYIIGNMSLLSECSETWKCIEETLIAQDAIGDEFPYA